VVKFYFNKNLLGCEEGSAFACCSLARGPKAGGRETGGQGPGNRGPGAGKPGARGRETGGQGPGNRGPGAGGQGSGAGGGAVVLKGSYSPVTYWSYKCSKPNVGDGPTGPRQESGVAAGENDVRVARQCGSCRGYVRGM
jgi:hypothetical protein